MNHVQVFVKSKKMDSIPMEVQEDLMLDTNKNLENVGLIVFLNNDYSLVMVYDKFHYSALNIINEMIMLLEFDELKTAVTSEDGSDDKSSKKVE
ncbi:hypothetical protein ES332_D12G142400v1 [Gossypium tomentosum]|uniref:Uncharacterized protein n=1 Tax=Gossypium tomentosum TaxID=34277 RepID=A0A5D2I940_GOSTO|nr:hypothetical protein ES332_D12G142400v1 [Gossypium tomentosum]